MQRYLLQRLRFFSLLFFILLTIVSPLLADTVVLKNGQEFTNVRTFLQSGHVSIIHRDGKINTLPVAMLGRIKRRPVDWEVGISEQEYEKRMEKELKAALDQAIQEREEREQSFRTGAMFRSALLPGWGQMYKSEYSKGGLFGLLFWGGVAATATADGKFRESRQKDRYYRKLHYISSTGYLLPDSGLPDYRVYTQLLVDQSTKKTRKLGQDAVYMAAFTGLIYILNVLDARYLGTVEGLDSSEAALEQGGANRGGFQFYLLDRPALASGRELSGMERKELGLSYVWKF